MLWIWREPPRLCARIGRDHDNKRTLCRREWEKQVRSSTLSFRQGKRKTHHPRFGLHLCVLANPSAGFGPCFFVCFLTMARGSLRNNGLRGPKHPTIEAAKAVTWTGIGARGTAYNPRHSNLAVPECLLFPLPF
jgi:hypothetical protein